MSTEGLKFDEGKPPLHLLPPAYWISVVDHAYAYRTANWFYTGSAGFPYCTDYDPLPVLQFGVKKYGAYNWYHGLAWSRVVSAYLRHVSVYDKADKIWKARDLDEPDGETGLPHGAHAACCWLFLREFYDNWIKGAPGQFGVGINDTPWYLAKQAQQGESDDASTTS